MMTDGMFFTDKQKVNTRYLMTNVCQPDFLVGMHWFFSSLYKFERVKNAS